MLFVRKLLCERTDILVLFWFFVAGYIFFYIAIPKFDNWLIQIGIAISYFVIPVKFNDWRERYCKKCAEIEFGKEE